MCYTRNAMGASTIESRIQTYFGALEHDEHHRYRSWEHCYRFFQRLTPARLKKEREEAALQLGFYLASWGMYRGRSFLLQRAYSVHRGVIDCLADPRWSRLWTAEFGADEDDDSKVADVVALRDCLGATYAKFGEPTDTLVTKIMLGTLACSPACDRYFVSGFTSEGNRYSCFNKQFVTRVLQFARTNLPQLRRAQLSTEGSVGARYPLMKLVDMYFFQTGLELEK